MKRVGFLVLGSVVLLAIALTAFLSAQRATPSPSTGQPQRGGQPQPGTRQRQTQPPPPQKPQNEKWVSIFHGVSGSYGRIQSVVKDVHDPSVVFATTHCGLYRTRDGGFSWSTLAEFDDSDVDLCRGPVFFAQSPAAPNTLYTGTPYRISRSTDAGANWNNITQGIPNTGLKAVYAHPQNPDIAFVLVGNHRASLFKTLNGGRSWGDVTPSVSVTISGVRQTPANIQSILIDPIEPEKLIAVTRAYADLAPPLESDDGGLSWHAIEFRGEVRAWQSTDYRLLVTKLPNAGNVCGLERKGKVLPLEEIGCAGNTWDGGGDGWRAFLGEKLWLIGGPSGLFLSRDRGQTWSKIVDSPTTAIAVISDTTFYAGTANAGLQKTIDGGKSWFTASLGLPADVLCCGPPGADALFGLTMFERGAAKAGAKLAAVGPSGRVYVGGGDSEYWFTDDGGVTWSRKRSPADERTVRQVVVDGDGNAYIGEVQISDFANTSEIARVPNAGQSTWLRTGHLPTMLTLVAQNKNQMLLSASEPGFGASVGLKAGSLLLLSDDAGFSWRPLPLAGALRREISSQTLSGIKSVQVSPNGQSVFVLTDTVVPRTLGTQRSQAVMVTRDGGNTWRDVSNAVAMAGGVIGSFQALTASEANPNLVFITARDVVYQSVDAGLTWSKLWSPANAGTLFSLSIDEGNPQQLFVGATSGAWRSSDGGRSWFLFNDGMQGKDRPDTVFFVLASKHGVYAQGRLGIYRLSDTGLSWAKDTWNRLNMAR